jgi:hypothetical protein
MNERVKNAVGAVRPRAPATLKSAPNDAAPTLINFTFPRKVVLFTPIKPLAYVERIARIVLDYDAEHGERFLQREMTVVSRNLLSTGADPPTIQREVRRLEASIRARIWHLVMFGEEAAR